MTAQPTGSISIAEACGIAQNPPSTLPSTAFLPAVRDAIAKTPINGRITVSGYEGSELLVARLLIESGAECAVRRQRLSAHPLVRCGPRMA